MSELTPYVKYFGFNPKYLQDPRTFRIVRNVVKKCVVQLVLDQVLSKLQSRLNENTRTILPPQIRIVVEEQITNEVQTSRDLRTPVPPHNIQRSTSSQSNVSTDSGEVIVPGRRHYMFENG